MFTIEREEIRGGDEGLLSKAGLMIAYAREDAVREAFWPIAYDVLKSSRFPPESDERARVQAIYDMLLSFVFVVAPPVATQYLLRPSALWARRMGDCTAFATFVAACGAVYGFKSDFIFTSTRPEGAWEHVWTRLWFPARLRSYSLDVDPSYRGSHAVLGWSLPEVRRTRTAVVEVM